MEKIKLEIYESKDGNYGWYLYDNRFHIDMESNCEWENRNTAQRNGEDMVQILLKINKDWSDMDMDMKQPSSEN